MNEVGTPAERAILGYVIDRPDRRLGLDELTADDFSDPTLGAIWDGISSDLIVGKTLDVVTLELRFADWGIVGEAADMCRVKMWDWVESGHSITLTQPIIDLIKRDATQRFAMHRMRSAISELGSGEHDPGTVLHGVVRDIHDRASGSKKEMFDSFMLGDLLEMEFTEDFVIPGLLERQDRVIITGVEGYGKALALDTPVLTTGGWSSMGDLKVGQSVFGRDGKATRIVAATNVMQDRECYTVRFSDGSEIVADAEHLWITDDYRSRQPNLKGGEGVRTTREIAETLTVRDGHCLNHSIRVAEPLVYPEADLPIPPYVLGAWLGDGHTASARFTCSDEDGPEMVEHFAAEGVTLTRKAYAEMLYLIEGAQVRLREIGVLGGKYIPDSYKRASFGQRLALAQGLMDSDGTIGRVKGSSRHEFCVTNERLAHDVHELLLGLGIKVTFTVDDARIKGRLIGDRYRMTFSTDLPMFRLKRKRDRLVRMKTKRATRRYITSVEPTESVPVRCIQVDNEDHTYLAGRNLIPTHNSTLARQILLYSAAGLHPFEEHMGIPMTIPKPTKCLVIDAENTVKQWSRNASWMVKKIHRYVQPGGRYTVSPAQNVVVVPTGRLNILKPEHLGMIHKLIDQHEPDIVFIGPLYRITRGGMNEENEAMEAIAALDTIRDRGVALVMEAHSGHSKDGNQRATRPRGSSALLGWPEFGMGIRPVVEFTPSGPVPQMGKFELNAWRGARERDRKWPEFLTHGTPNDPFPWMSDDEEEPDDGGYGSVGSDGVVPG